MSTAAERRREIGQTISEAMKKLDIDWTREGAAITTAQAEMEEAMALYCEGKASKIEVKRAYKTWVNAHRGG
jgi:hypothetical protein